MGELRVRERDVATQLVHQMLAQGSVILVFIILRSWEWVSGSDVNANVITGETAAAGCSRGILGLGGLG